MHPTPLRYEMGTLEDVSISELRELRRSVLTAGSRRAAVRAALSTWRCGLHARTPRIGSWPLPLKPPIKPQLALSRKALPEGEEWAYEPKWDGFRALASSTVTRSSCRAAAASRCFATSPSS